MIQLHRAEASESRRPFSVIMLLPEHHGHFAAAIKSWTSQLYPVGDYELIVAADGAEPKVEEAARALLRPNDRMMVWSGVKRSGLLDRAARAAKHDQLVFTESHVEADPDFLRELDTWLAHHPDLAGACCRTMSSYTNNFAWFDALLYEEGYRIYRSDDDWRKINIHAFTLSREWFIRAGGLDETYNLFAEMILAANLRDLGGKMGYAPGPAVLHHYRTNVDGPEESVREFIRDESNYRRAHPGPDQLGFSVLPDVSAYFSGNTGLWRSAFASVLRHGLFNRQSLRLLPKLAWNAAKELLSASGPKSAARRLAWTIRWHKLMAHLWRWNRALLEPHYRRLWILYGFHERLLYLAGESVIPDSALNVSGEPHSVAIDLGHCAAGVHDCENYLNQPFRWTQPMSVWRLAGLSANNSLHFKTHAVRSDLTANQLTICVNGKVVPTAQLHFSAEGLTIDLAGLRIDQSKPTTLLISVPALRPWLHGQPDRRELGTPVISVGSISAALNQKSAA